jgi:hypothetical protein
LSLLCAATHFPKANLPERVNVVGILIDDDPTIGDGFVDLAQALVDLNSVVSVLFACWVARNRVTQQLAQLR